MMKKIKSTMKYASTKATGMKSGMKKSKPKKMK
jgi:hypothetical protein